MHFGPSQADLLKFCKSAWLGPIWIGLAQADLDRLILMNTLQGRQWYTKATALDFVLPLSLTAVQIARTAHLTLLQTYSRAWRRTLAEARAMRTAATKAALGARKIQGGKSIAIQSDTVHRTRRFCEISSWK